MVMIMTFCTYKTNKPICRHTYIHTYVHIHVYINMYTHTYACVNKINKIYIIRISCDKNVPLKDILME